MSKEPLDLLGKERRQTLIKEIITYFKVEREEEIGVRCDAEGGLA